MVEVRWRCGGGTVEGKPTSGRGFDKVFHVKIPLLIKMNSGDGRIFNDQPQDSHSHGVLLQNQPPSAAAEIDEDHSEHDIDQDSAIGSSHGYVSTPRQRKSC